MWTAESVKNCSQVFICFVQSPVTGNIYVKCPLQNRRAKKRLGCKSDGKHWFLNIQFFEESKSNKKFTKFSNLIIAPSHPLFACKELSSALSKYSKQIRHHKSVQRQVRCYDVPVICERKTDKMWQIELRNHH
jgi:hypothetical protein